MLFDEAFHVFWRNPRLLERVRSLLLPTVHTPPRGDARLLSRRLADAIFAGAGDEMRARETENEIERDAVSTWSEQEVLRARDFEEMSTAELAAAKTAIARLRLAIPKAPTRRYRPHPQGSLIDMRTTFRRSVRLGSNAFLLARRQRRRVPAPLVVICDISGSMNRYSRVLLHFAHALARDRTRVHSFVFGTRLTNITRQLRNRDVDAAIDLVSARGVGLERWHPHRAMPRHIQSGMVPSGMRPGCDRPAHFRRARRRRRRRPRAPGGTASQVVPPARVAESSASLRALRAEGGGDARPPAPCGRASSGAQPREPGRSLRSSHHATVPSTLGARRNGADREKVSGHLVAGPIVRKPRRRH